MWLSLVWLANTYRNETACNSPLQDDHESDVDPSDSEWEQDTGLKVKRSNREVDEEQQGFWSPN